MSVQISAYISDATKDRFEAYSLAHGIKKAFLIENALELYLSALEEIPAQFIEQQKIIVSNKTFAQIQKSQNCDPTEALKKLMQDD